MLDRKTFLLKTERGEMEVGRGDEVLLEYTDYIGYDGATRVPAKRIARVERLRDTNRLGRPDYIQIDWMGYVFNLDGYLLGSCSEVVKDGTRIHPLTPEVRYKYELTNAWATILTMTDDDWNRLHDEDAIAITKIIEKRLGK